MRTRCALAILGCVLALLACGDGSDDALRLPARQVERPRPIVIDEVAGRYRGVTVGMTRPETIRRARERPRTDSDDNAPVGSGFTQDGTPSSWSPPGGGTERGATPACRVRVAPRRYLGFGQSPVRSIALMTVPFDGG